MQPIIRGIQTVGHADILYRYNLLSDGSYYLPIPKNFTFYDNDTLLADDTKQIDCTTSGIAVAGFTLDGEFLRANPQLQSSFVIPILGGGGVALTNNNRTGTLTLTCAKVSVPNLSSDTSVVYMKQEQGEGASIGVDSSGKYYDLVTLAQIQQAQDGGDAYGANITIRFDFSNVRTELTFQACTVATVDPVGLSGNDAARYTVVFNYLNWTAKYIKLKDGDITVNAVN